MLRRSFRIGLTLGLLGGLVFALVKAFGPRRDDGATRPAARHEPWPALVPDPAAPSPVADVVAEAVVAPAAGWVEPIDGGCPTSHPVKGKLSSKIFHLPGMRNYERTKPDRCYVDAHAAEADGLRAAKQ